MAKSAKNQDNTNLTRAAIRMRELRAAETDEQRDARRAKERDRQAAKRAAKREATSRGTKRPAEQDGEVHRVVIPRLDEGVEELTGQLDSTHLPPIAAGVNIQAMVRPKKGKRQISRNDR